MGLHTSFIFRRSSSKQVASCLSKHLLPAKVFRQQICERVFRERIDENEGIACNSVQLCEVLLQP